MIGVSLFSRVKLLVYFDLDLDLYTATSFRIIPHLSIDVIGASQKREGHQNYVINCKHNRFLNDELKCEKHGDYTDPKLLSILL